MDAQQNSNRWALDFECCVIWDCGWISVSYHPRVYPVLCQDVWKMSLLKKKGAGSGIEGNYAQLSKKGHCLIKQVMENRFRGSTCGEFPCCEDTDVCQKFFWHSAFSGTAISSGDERSVSEPKSCFQRGSGPCGGQWNHSQFCQIQSCCWTVLKAELNLSWWFELLANGVVITSFNFPLKANIPKLRKLEKPVHVDEPRDIIRR